MKLTEIALEDAVEYLVLPMKAPQGYGHAILIGDRIRVERFLYYFSVDAFVATYGTAARCTIVMDAAHQQVIEVLNKVKRYEQN